MRVRWLLWLAVPAVLVVSGCTPADQPAAPLHWTRTELYFGRSMPGGQTVADAQWQTFLDQCVTPRFPDGLTVVDAAGQWTGSDGKAIAEKTKLLILLHRPGEAANRAIDEIRRDYKRRFGQESVLRASSPANVSF